MLDSLQRKWKVTGLQVILILCTFAIGGSITGYVGRKLMNLFDLEKNVLWVIIYILLITIIWPMAVILISIPFGQFRFFTQYLRKIGSRMGLTKKVQEVPKFKVPGTRIAIFASGAGSNAQKIIDHFRHSSLVRIALIVCNKPGAGVISIAEREKIPLLLIDKDKFFRGNGYVDELKANQIDFIVLAGFLWKIPTTLINAYPGHIINIHPALLPAYGGKGMYGEKVHQAVIAAGEKESGISIHYVDEIYDHGANIFQAKCNIEPGDTAETLAKRIHLLEHEHYPRVIEQLIREVSH